MIITRAETILVSIPFKAGGIPPWSFGGDPKCNFDTLLIRLETDSGLVGWGEAFSRNEDHALKTMIDTRVLPLVVGRDAASIASLKFDLEFQLHNFGRIGPIMYGISGVDIALWDLLGKATDRRLVDLLGGSFAEELTVYASLLRYGDPNEVARITREAIERGYRHIKLHEVSLPVIEAAVTAAGQDASVMLDTNCPWSVAQALRYDRVLEPLGLTWLEEPVWPPENFSALSTLRTEYGIPVAAGENACTHWQFESMFDAKAVDVAQPSVTKVGGVTEFLEVEKAARERKVTIAPHSPYFGPGFLATAQLISAMDEDVPFERFYMAPEASLFGTAIDPVDGMLLVPQGPGLGLEPDPDVILEYRVDN